MRRLLLVAAEVEDVRRLSAALEGEPYELTPSCAHGALESLSTFSYDALVISESLFHGPPRAHTHAVVGLARRLGIPVLLFPASDAPQGRKLVTVGAVPAPRERAASALAPDRRERIRALFEEAIRPAFQARGGDVELVDILGDRVVLRFLGICTACPTARERHRMEIEKFLRSEAPPVKHVVVEQAGFPPGRWC